MLAKCTVYKKYVEQYLAKRKAKHPFMKPVKVQKFADNEEQDSMEQCHLVSYILLEQFLDELQQLDKGRALEVAAGDGRTTKDLLRHRFEKVDCFDRCPVAVKKLEALRAKYPKIDLVDQATMQGYVWQRQYTGIFLRWCSGYLTDLELVAFLKTAANQLQPSAVKTTRHHSPGAFIFVFDNVLGPKERAVSVKG